MRKFITIFMLFIATLGFALGRLEVESVETLDETNLQISKYDADGKYAPLLFVKTDLKPILFQNVGRGNRNEPVWDEMNNRWKCYLNVGQNRIKIGSTGYDPIEINLRDYGVMSDEKRCYVLTLIDHPEHEVIPFNIMSDPSDAEKWVDGENLGKGQGFQLAVGSHQLELRKSGYRTKKLTIDVNKSTPFVNVDKMALQDPVLFTVKSQPTGADIYLDGAASGVTDRQITLFPGSYTVRLVKGGYDPEERTIQVTENGANSVTFQLTKATSTITVVTEPSDAEVFLNNALETARTFEKGPGTYRIEVKKSGYDSDTRMITVEKGKDQTVNVTLTRQTGRLAFTVQPIDAQVTLTNGDNWQGGKVTTLPVGEYTIEATCSGYDKKTTRITIEKDKMTTLDLVLEKRTTTQAASSTGTSGIEMVFVEGGTYQMGSNDGDGDEKPVHSVTVSSFYIGKYEVTQKQWKDVMGKNPSNWKGDNLPVENVSWYDVVEFCNKLSEREGLTPCYTGSGDNIRCNFKANGYRLPTEAEWEYAARGGKKSKGYKYSGSNTLGDVGWFKDNSGKKTHDVGGKRANELGIYDMSGNVWEWCWDQYGSYSSGEQTNPTGPATGSSRVIRGGYWYNSAYYCEVAFRSYSAPSVSNYYIGFRLCRTSQ